jgi:hypothetical protein
VPHAQPGLCGPHLTGPSETVDGVIVDHAADLSAAAGQREERDALWSANAEHFVVHTSEIDAVPILDRDDRRDGLRPPALSGRGGAPS